MKVGAPLCECFTRLGAHLEANGFKQGGKYRGVY